MAQPVKGIHLMGLSLMHTASTFMKGYQVPSGGDWPVHRNAMVLAQGTEGLVISGCTFTAPGGNGIFIGYGIIFLVFCLVVGGVLLCFIWYTETFQADVPKFGHKCVCLGLLPCCCYVAIYCLMSN